MEGPISSRNQDRQGTTGNQETTPPLSPWPGPFVVSEYVALPGDRVGFVATDPQTGICCPGRDDRALAEQDAEALNAAYASGFVAAAGHTCMVQTCLALADGLEGAALLASERAERLRRSVELFRAAKVETTAIPAGRNPAACENELATAIEGVAADDNDGSLQHTPTTWIGNEQVNRPAGGGE